MLSGSGGSDGDDSDKSLTYSYRAVDNRTIGMMR